MTDSPTENGTETRPVPFISRVRLKNYKSIAECDVRLGPLTILVGPNGSGKSNFLDALAFVARALESTPAKAIDERGGIAEIIRRVPHATESFTIAVEVKVPWEPSAHLPGKASYEFEIARSQEPAVRSFDIIREECILQREDEVWRYRGDRNNIYTAGPSVEITEPAERDQLYLATGARALEAFRPLRAGLISMQFYNFASEAIREPSPSAARPVLERTGRNLGDVLAAMTADNRGYKERFDEYIRAVVNGAIAVDPYPIGEYMTVALRAAGSAGTGEVKFGPLSMSDGTIRAAAVLAALFQPFALDGRLPLIGIEEPEVALHPGAAGVLFDALTEASQHVQIIAASQSADLLDREDLHVSDIRPVTMQYGLTVVGEVDDASREIVEKRLYTLGELMRGNQLSPGVA